MLGGHFDVSRRQEEYLVGNALHAAVERVRETAGEVDQALREILVGALQVEDDGDRVLELVRDLLCIVETARDDEMHTHGRRPGKCGDARPLAHHRRAFAVGLGIGPVVELALAPARSEPAHIRAFRVRPLDVLVGDVALLVPVVLFGDAKVDERPVPDVREAHRVQCYSAPRTGPARSLRTASASSSSSPSSRARKTPQSSRTCQ